MSRASLAFFATIMASIFSTSSDAQVAYVRPMFYVISSVGGIIYESWSHASAKEVQESHPGSSLEEKMIRPSQKEIDESWDEDANPR
jgi:hypothetical protein